MANANASGIQILGDSNPLGTVVLATDDRLSTTGTVTGYTSVGGSAVLSQSTFTGNSGSKAYTIGDIVLALKTIGILASS